MLDATSPSTLAAVAANICKHPASYTTPSAHSYAHVTSLMPLFACTAPFTHTPQEDPV
jgi:hypothetical protein